MGSRSAGRPEFTAENSERAGPTVAETSVQVRFPAFSFHPGRKNVCKPDLNEGGLLVILRPLSVTFHFCIPETFGSWVPRERVRVGERLVARNVVCDREFAIARANPARFEPFHIRSALSAARSSEIVLLGSSQKLNARQIQSAELFSCADPDDPHELRQALAVAEFTFSIGQVH